MKSLETFCRVSINKCFLEIGQQELEVEQSVVLREFEQVVGTDSIQQPRSKGEEPVLVR